MLIECGFSADTRTLCAGVVRTHKKWRMLYRKQFDRKKAFLQFLINYMMIMIYTISVIFVFCFFRNFDCNYTHIITHK